MMSSAPLLARWVMICATAEFLGIAGAAAWYGGINAFIGEPEPIPLRAVAWFLMSLAAVPEGVILGGLQFIGIKMFVAGVSGRRWIAATIFVGFLGWGIGSFVPMFVMTQAPDAATTDPMSELKGALVFAAAFGALIGAVFGAAQAWGLPRGGGRRVSWTVANAIGWAVALPMIYGAAQIAAEYSGWAPRIAIWAAGGLAAGILLGVFTGIALLRMRRAAPPQSSAD